MPPRPRPWAAAAAAAAWACGALASAPGVSGSAQAPLPLVLWHGMGDTGYPGGSMEAIAGWLVDAGVPYVKAVALGGSAGEDVYAGFYGSVNRQVEEVCAALRGDARLTAAGEINAVGFSQGAQFLRAYVQRCNDPPVRNLISVGGQQQGVFGVPACDPASDSWSLCQGLSRVLSAGAYLSAAQARVVQAQYWHDPTRRTAYAKSSRFLADINNEPGAAGSDGARAAQYRANLGRLHTFVMVKFLRDSMVYPSESSWFGYFDEDMNVRSLRESPLYTDGEDVLGLRRMDTEGRLVFLDLDSDHLQFTREWFEEHIVLPYLLG